MPNDVQVIDVICQPKRPWKNYFMECLAIKLSQLTPQLIVGIKKRQLNTQDGSLNFIKAAVDTPLHICKTCCLSIISQSAQAFRELRIIRDNCTCITISTEIFSG